MDGPSTKIVCTLGPASVSPPVLAELVRRGMSVARLNFSHGRREEHARALVRVRREARRQGRRVAVLMDLQGPKIRLGLFRGGQAVLARGADFTLTTEIVEGDAGTASVSHRGLPRDVRKGDAILLDDGRIRLRVRAVAREKVRCLVEQGGPVGDRKGVNLPGIDISLPALTRKDRDDLAFGLSLGVDFVALSFVRRPGDVVALRKRIRAAGSDVPVVAKLEMARAIENLDGILDASDGVIVARGDLGVETAIEEVPLLQKRILREAASRGVVAITATQMLESMTRAAVPTRAEVSDVANAVLDGSDAVMLSGETSVGSYPAEAVEVMRRVLENVETEKTVPGPLPGVPRGIEEAVGAAACRAAADLRARAVAVFSRTGETARILSKLHPPAPIYAFTPRDGVANRMALYRGVRPLLLPVTPDPEAMVDRAVRYLDARGLAKSGEEIVFVYGSASGHCDQMRVVRC